jgi:hypothetical protein
MSRLDLQIGRVRNGNEGIPDKTIETTPAATPELPTRTRTTVPLGAVSVTVYSKPTTLTDSTLELGHHEQNIWLDLSAFSLEGTSFPTV